MSFSCFTTALSCLGRDENPTELPNANDVTYFFVPLVVPLCSVTDFPGHLIYKFQQEDSDIGYEDFKR